MASVILFLCIVFLVYSILLVLSHSHSINVNTKDGFSISLIHCDSSQSPFYKHSKTTYECNAEAPRRSINRQHHHLMSLKSGATTTRYNPPYSPPDDISTEVISDGAGYLATIYLGTPTKPVTVLVDTGSGVNWVKGPPVFDASKSISYKLLNCDIDSCPSQSSCNRDSDLCEFLVTYSDDSTASGIISFEDFSFDGPNGENVTAYNLQFGYATQASSPPFYYPRNGILALNQEPGSFISQLNIKKFSHCFGFDVGSESRMYFGSRAVMANLTTPIEPSMNTGYYITLDGISVGDKLVDVPPDVFKLNEDSTGGVMLDTGTTITKLRSQAYEPFKSEMTQRINRTLVDPPFKSFDLCFNGRIDDLGDLPDVTLRFARVDIQLIKKAIYVQAADGVLCLTFSPSNMDKTTIGNYPMRNLLVGYDLGKMEISFGPANCSAL